MILCSYFTLWRQLKQLQGPFQVCTYHSQCMLKYLKEHTSSYHWTVRSQAPSAWKNVFIHNNDFTALPVTNLATSLASRNLLTNGMKAWMSEVMASASGCRKSSSPSTFCIDLKHIWRDSSVRWFFGLFSPCFFAKNVSKCQISQGRARFCSLDAVREWAKRAYAHSSTARKAFLLTVWAMPKRKTQMCSSMAILKCHLFRIRILLKVSDPTGTGSTTLYSIAYC